MAGRTYEDNDQLFSTISFHFKTYKTCWVDPFASKVSGVPNKDIQQPILSPEHTPSTLILASEEIKKRRKMARGQVSHGQVSKIWISSCSFVQNSLVADITVDNLEWTPFEEPIENPEAGIQQNNIHQPPAPGIQWISHSANFDHPTCVVVPKQQCCIMCISKRNKNSKLCHKNQFCFKIKSIANLE